MTACIDESIKPFVKDATTPGCAVVGLSTVSSCTEVLLDKCDPSPLVKRAKVDITAFPDCGSPCTDR